MWSAYQPQDRGETGRRVWFTFTKADRRVTCYYFYLWDGDFGPAFIKVCAYFPYPVKVWLNGHEWAKRQATHAGIGFTELSNGFATCEDPEASAGDLRPARPRRHRRVLRTLDEPAAAAADPGGPGRRLLVGAVDAADRDLPHHRVRRTPPSPGVLRGARGRQPRHRPPRSCRADLPPATGNDGAAHPRSSRPTRPGSITRDTIGVTVNADYKHSRIKQYLKDGRALRIETVINTPDDLLCKRRLDHLDELQAKARDRQPTPARY